MFKPRLVYIKYMLQMPCMPQSAGESSKIQSLKTLPFASFIMMHQTIHANLFDRFSKLSPCDAGRALCTLPTCQRSAMLLRQVHDYVDPSAMLLTCNDTPVQLSFLWGRFVYAEFSDGIEILQYIGPWPWADQKPSKTCTESSKNRIGQKWI